MKRLSLLPLLISLLLGACAPAAPTATVTPTAAPTATSTPTATVTPTPSPTPIPTLPPAQISGLEGVPDPRAANPELFDLTKPDAPIPQFVNAMKMGGINLIAVEVLARLHPQLETPEGLPPFITYRTSDGVALMMTVQNPQTKEWEWKVAIPGGYWHAQGKVIGLYMNNEEFGSQRNRDLVRSNFSNGVLSTSEQVRPNASPYRPPSNANRLANDAQVNQMGLFFHYVAEPGKFPADINISNIDFWIDYRLEGVIQVIKDHKTKGQPTYVSFNEAWEGNVWNQESNPLRNKYGNKWVEEYTFQLLSKFINAGLVPNKDFVIVFNDANLYNRPNKQNLVFKTLSEARFNAFNRLTSDPNVMQKLQEMGINKPEDINILLGVETHTKLGQNVDDGNFVPEPTDGEIINLSNKFGSSGGILMTEVNPYGTVKQKQDFLKRLSALLQTNPNLKGILLWNMFHDSDDGKPNLIFGLEVLNLFNEDGTPTSLYYSLLYSK